MCCLPEGPIPEDMLREMYGGSTPRKPRGLGDTVAHFTHATGLDRLAHLYTQVTGRDCGCGRRQEALNRLVPYKNLQPE